MGQYWSELFPPKPTFIPARDMPDLSGKVMIVTGGNSGIGKETVKHLLAKNAKVYLAARSKANAELAIAELKEATGKEAIFLELNLANLDAVTRAAKEFQSKEPALHVLFNSAGVMDPPKDLLTDDGYDLTFGTNVLGPAHFTLLLIPQLIEGAKSFPNGKARVINVSSWASHSHKKIVFESAQGGTKQWKSMGGYDKYGQSKFANVVFSNELARCHGDYIASNAVHPGSIRTELYRTTPTIATWFMNKLLFYPLENGALTSLYAGTVPEAGEQNGAWFYPWGRVSAPDKATKNPELGTRLWDWVEEQRKGHL